MYINDKKKEKNHQMYKSHTQYFVLYNTSLYGTDINVCTAKHSKQESCEEGGKV